jgi:hypothetical protein
VYTYTQSSSDGNWVLASTLIGTGTASYFFGSCLDISADGTTLSVGESGGNFVWVYTGTAGTGVWTLQRKILQTDASFVGSVSFGSACALAADGNTLAIGATGHNSDQGGLVVFSRSAGVWSTQSSSILAPGSAAGKLGWTVAINAAGDRIAAGAPTDSAQAASNGAVYVFTRDGSLVWSSRHRVVPTGSALPSLRGFGYGLDLSATGDTLVVGAEGETMSGVQTGAWWHFEWNSGTLLFAQVGAKKSPPGLASGARVGRAMAIAADGQTVAGSNTERTINPRGWHGLRDDFVCRSFVHVCVFARVCYCCCFSCSLFLVGAPLSASNGHVFLYSRNVSLSVTSASEPWQLLSPQMSVTGLQSQFGAALALSDSTMEIVVGGQSHRGENRHMHE